MQGVIGGLLGCGAGLAAWLVAQCFVKAGAGSGPEKGPAPRACSAARARSALLWAAAGALGGLYLGWRAPDLAHVTLGVSLTGLLAALSRIDFGVRRLPNVLLGALLAWAVGQVLWLGKPSPVAAALGMAVGGGLFLGLALLRRRALGAGDVKLAAALGAAVGFPLVLPALLYGVLAGGAAALILLVTKRARRTDYMAYGPYLALGAWLVWTHAAGLWP